MGQRLSCLCDCCRAQESGGDDNERTRLLTPSSGVGGEFHSEGGSEEGFGYSFNVEGSLDVGESGDSELGDRPSEEGKAEQTALSKILHDAAHELIDVSGATLQSAAVSSSLENHEFAERAQDYSIKLFLAAPNLALKYNEDTLSTDNWTDGLSLVNSSTEQETMLSDGSISYEDIDLLNVLSDKIADSMYNMKKNPNRLVIPFGNPEE